MSRLFSKVPIPMFRMIQEFLDEQDYRELMNSNLSTFPPIKYETVYYSLVGPETWIGFAKENKEATVMRIINSVKDKTKQIAMRIKGATQSLLMKYGHLFEGISKLTVEELTIEEDFSFAVFNKIRCLKLDHIGTDSDPLAFRVNLDLENLEDLELEYCQFREIVAWNSSRCLKKLTITGCSNLASIPPVDGITVVSVTATSALQHFQSTGGHKTFTNVGSHLDQATMLAMNRPSFYKELKELKLCGTFAGVPDFAFCQQIPLVDLSNHSSIVPYPSLPVLHGRELKINHFSLGRWTGQFCANLVHCELTKCIDLVQFPDMGSLELLTLKDCVDLVGIPSLASLMHLNILECPRVKNIAFSPELESVILTSCDSFEDLSAFGHVHSVCLYYCNKITSILPLQDVTQVNISNCPSIADLESISNLEDHYMVRRRRVTLSNVTISTNLQNIYHLILDRYTTSTLPLDLSLIDDVHHLQINYCSNLTTTKGLGTVTGSLSISHCAKLTSLEGLENIPEVSIMFCPSVEDFTGLGHHKALTVLGSTAFEKVIEEFEKERKHSELFGSIGQLYTD
jgi:hypothetical protein